LGLRVADEDAAFHVSGDFVSRDEVVAGAEHIQPAFGRSGHGVGENSVAIGAVIQPDSHTV
jgi:hypothetical protein